MSRPSSPRPNPYVGPRAFRYGETLYARDQEIAELLDLLIAERIVLLHSPSGAGKTSLIQAGLIPRLEQDGFTVLPVMRVALTPREALASVPNRHVLSTLLSLEEPRPEASRLSLETLARLSLVEYLSLRPEFGVAAGGLVLVFDQFEEILTATSSDHERRAFFADVGAGVQDKNRWALFSMREEYVGALDPFLRPVPTRLKSRYRLSLLRAPAAQRAIQLPARSAGVDFTDDAATALITDLRRTTVQRPDGGSAQVTGEFVEPVQLQVVCHRLWSRLPADRTRIDVEDVRGLHDVDTALAEYYTDSVGVAAAEAGVSERAIRDWFEQQLFTRDGIRRMVLLERETIGPVAAAVRPMVDAHLLRLERRSGATYVELSHDRLVEPVRTDNARWREAHLTVLQRQAALWQQESRPDGLLLSGERLVEAERWGETHAADLNAVERDFLLASRRARSATRNRKTVLQLGVTLVLLLLGISYYAFGLWVEVRPWAQLYNLASGAIYELRGNFASVGRSTPALENHVSLLPNVVSRIHLFITREGKAIDMRSLNGTVINGEFLTYGEVRWLTDGDHIVLADIAPFEFRRVTYWLQIWAPPVERRIVPPGAWAMVIDAGERKHHYLVQAAVTIGIDGNDRLLVGDGSPPDASARMVVRRHAEAVFTVEDRDDGADLWAEMKMGDYTYRACRVPPGQEWDRLVWRRMACEEILARPDLPEGKLSAYAPFRATYAYPDRKLRFRIVPVVPGLDDARRH